MPDRRTRRRGELRSAPRRGGPLRGRRGSGTIFFSWCNLRCVYCQNWEISAEGRRARGTSRSDRRHDARAAARRAATTSTSSRRATWCAQILAAVAIAAERGLRLPLVYNTGGYDSLEALALLDGVVDIYMPDMKYGDAALARRYSKVRDYAEVNQAAVREMHRQVGDLVLDERRDRAARAAGPPPRAAGRHRRHGGGARRSSPTEISPDTYLNLMDQYRPCYRADEYPRARPADHHRGISGDAGDRGTPRPGQA